MIRQVMRMARFEGPVRGEEAWQKVLCLLVKDLSSSAGGCCEVLTEVEATQLLEFFFSCCLAPLPA